MANFAHIEDGKLKQVCDFLPDNWKNISNFPALAKDENMLNQNGWFKITRIIPAFDPVTEQLSDELCYKISETETMIEVIEEQLVKKISSPPSNDEISLQWERVKSQRTILIERFCNDLRFTSSISVSSETAITLGSYLISLLTVFDDQADPFNIIWPTLNLSSTDDLSNIFKDWRSLI